MLQLSLFNIKKNQVLVHLEVKMSHLELQKVD